MNSLRSGIYIIAHNVMNITFELRARIKYLSFHWTQSHVYIYTEQNFQMVIFDLVNYMYSTIKSNTFKTNHKPIFSFVNKLSGPNNYLCKISMLYFQTFCKNLIYRMTNNY